MKRLIIILSLGGVLSCGSGNTAGQQEADIAPVVAETVNTSKEITSPEAAPDVDSGATATSGEMTFNGIIVMPPQSHATVSLSIDGIVRKTSLLPGAYVQKGTVLATIENPELIELQEAYLDASAQFEFLESEYNRQKALAQEEAASNKKLEQSKADYLSMKSRRDGAYARLTMLGLDVEKLQRTGIIPLLEVKAPISGYISNVEMNIGKHITAGEPLCEIIDKSNMLVKLTAYEKDLKNIRTGDAIEFRVNGIDTDTFTGRITSIGHHVDNTSRAIEVYALVNDKNNMFRPGMYVNAHITGK